MKRFIGAILFLLAFAFGAAAQSYVQDTITSTLPTTYSVAATTTNTTIASSNIIASVTRSKYVTLQPIFKLQGAGTSAVVFLFDESTDGSTWESSAHSVSVTAAGTTQVTTVQNVQLEGIGFLRLAEIRNPNGTAVTNLSVKISYKTGL